jgi:hypothetical protein
MVLTWLKFLPGVPAEAVGDGPRVAESRNEVIGGVHRRFQKGAVQSLDL